MNMKALEILASQLRKTPHTCWHMTDLVTLLRFLAEVTSIGEVRRPRTDAKRVEMSSEGILKYSGAPLAGFDNWCWRKTF